MIAGGIVFCPDVLAGYAPEDASREERFANPPASARMLPIWHDWKNDIKFSGDLPLHGRGEYDTIAT